MKQVKIKIEYRKNYIQNTEKLNIAIKKTSQPKILKARSALTESIDTILLIFKKMFILVKRWPYKYAEYKFT